MPDRPSFGGLDLEAGDHICGLYSGTRQRDEILLPFLADGLAAGDKCICVVDGTVPDEIVELLGSRQVDAATHAADGALDVIRSSDLYLRSGSFSADEIIGCWKAAISDAMYDGRFNLVRGLETWSCRDVVPDSRELLRLESAMSRYLPLFPQVIVCLYDLERFGGGMVVDLLRTHPRVLVSGALVENPYYRTPDELLAEDVLDGTTAPDAELEEVAEWCYAVTTGST